MIDIDSLPRFIQQIVHSVPSVIYVFDIRRRKIVFLNRSGAAHDYVEESQDPEFVRSLLHPDDWQRVLDYLDGL